MVTSAWAAEVVKTVGEQPIFLTWNFFVTIIGLPVLGWFLSRLIKTSDEMKERLFRSVIENIERTMEDWQNGAKERSKSLCEKIDKLSAKVDAKVDNHECERVHRLVDAQITDLKRKHQ